MSQPKFLPVLSRVLETLSQDDIYFDESQLQIDQLLCRVISVSPEFIISDGFHSMTCEFSDPSVFKFTKKYPDKTLKDLDSEYLTIMKFTFLIKFASRDAHPKLIFKIGTFFYTKMKPYFDEKFAYDKPLIENCEELAESLERMRKLYIKNEIGKMKEKLNLLDSLEVLMAQKDNLDHTENVGILQKNKEENKQKESEKLPKSENMSNLIAENKIEHMVKLAKTREQKIKKEENNFENFMFYSSRMKRPARKPMPSNNVLKTGILQSIKRPMVPIEMRKENELKKPKLL